MSETNSGRYDWQFLTLKEPQKRMLMQLLSIGLIGAIIMLAAGLFSAKETLAPPIESGVSHPPSTGESPLAYASLISSELERVLASVEGAGQVSALVSIESTPESVFQLNETIRSNSTQEAGGGNNEKSTQSAEKSLEVVTFRNLSGSSESPVITRILSPRVTGVLIVAQGAKNPEIKMSLINAVQALLDIPAHKVLVLPAR